MKNCRKFSAEFKQEAIRSLKTSGKSAAVLARELGLPVTETLSIDSRTHHRRTSLGFP